MDPSDGVGFFDMASLSPYSDAFIDRPALNLQGHKIDRYVGGNNNQFCGFCFYAIL